MPFIFTSETTLEKLDPPITVAGLTAELAEVTRQYQIEIPGNVKTQVNETKVEILWNTTVVEKIAEITASKAEAQAEVQKVLDKLDADTVKLESLKSSELAIAIEDVAIITIP